jgi:hypothetical protein
MKSKIHWILTLVIVVFICFFGWTQQGRGSSKPLWEYKVIPSPSTYPEKEKLLNELGAEGWELVQHQSPNDIDHTGNLFYLKRAK